MVLQSGKLNLVIDLQWGSTGKGAISRYLAEKENIDASLCIFSPNSAHTSVESDGTKYIVKQLPQAAALVAQGADIELLIGADACINPAVLEREIVEFKADKNLRIHPNAVIITDRCIEKEQKSLVRISSTLQGTSYAKSMKLTRHPEVVLAKDHPITKEFVDFEFDDYLISLLASNKKVLGDFHQGYELSVNSRFYPYVTSSTVNTASFLASFNLPPKAVGTVVGTARTFPIRVGNVKDNSGNVVGFSGQVYPDQEEYTWEDIQRISGSSDPLVEYTTLTKKVRRIFSFSHSAMKKAVIANQVDFLYLNFVNYLDCKVYGVKRSSELTGKVLNFVKEVEQKCNVPVKWVGTGPQNNHIIEMENV